MADNLLNTGISLNNWFAISHSRDLKPKQAIPIIIWNKYFVLYRDEIGNAHALDDRCAHRKVALHKGIVKNCNIVCPYHGWEYNGQGHLTTIPYWSNKKKFPAIKLQDYPICEKDGIIWMFPGDPTKANPDLLPDTSCYNKKEWVTFCLDNHFHNHFAIGAINGMDFLHFHLHRKYQPWADIEITDIQKTENRITGEYTITLKQGKASNIFKLIQGLYRKKQVKQSLKVHLLYPYHFAELDNNINIWVYFTPIDQKNAKVFITMYVKASGMTRKFKILFKHFFSRFVLKKIQLEDAWIGAEEQIAWERYPFEGRYEINPISAAVQKMLIDKWKEYINEEAIKSDTEKNANIESLTHCDML